MIGGEDTNSFLIFFRMYPLITPTCRGETTFRVGRNAQEKIMKGSRKGTAFKQDRTGIRKRKEYMLKKGNRRPSP